MNNLSFFKWIVSISFCLMLFSCSSTKGNRLPDPEMKDGIAKLSGKITNLHPTRRMDNLKLILIVPRPINGENYSYQATSVVDEDGDFAFEVPMQCNYAIGYIRMDYYDYEGFNVCLTSGKETKMELIYDEAARLKIANQTDSLGLISTDLFSMNRAYKKIMNTYIPGTTGNAKTPDEYVQRAKIGLNNRLKMIAENDALSEIAKNYVANSIKIHTLDWRLLRDRGMMQVYLNAGSEDIENFKLQEPKKYYVFLKNFDLNNPQYLYQDHYPEVLKMILSNETLNIPPIGDTPIAQWMKEVKNSLSKLVGFNKGLFYDLLAANSYAQQFNDELRPLSDKQIKNIHHYFKGEKEEIAKILWKKNDVIVQFAAHKEPLVVNETPKVSKEKLMDAIISKYKGKVVVVDSWSVWCAPYLEYRTIQGELKGKEVVFVYLTNSSFPKKLWEKKIKGIGGEHYYLKDEELQYIMEAFQFSNNLSYVIFDAQGVVRHQFTGYPGNAKMQAMIEELLPF